MIADCILSYNLMLMYDIREESGTGTIEVQGRTATFDEIAANLSENGIENKQDLQDFIKESTEDGHTVDEIEAALFGMAYNAEE